MKIITWNVKGLTDPQKAEAISSWLFKGQMKLDFLCLQEIKATGTTVKQRLRTVHPGLTWLHTPNNQGTGGAAIGVHPQSTIEEVLCSSASQPNWIGVKIGGPTPYTVISIYAGGSVPERTQIWEELSSIQGEIILAGYFNMVENIDDRWESKGQTIRGQELLSWTNLKNMLDLADMGNVGEFTWQNYSPPPLARKARLDRAYVSRGLANSFIRVKAAPSYSSCASDHYPVVLNLDNKDNKVRANWFHTDPKLFKLPCVQEAMERIWNWGGPESPAAKWSKAVKLTQELLIQVKKQVTLYRKNKEEAIYAKLGSLEAKNIHITQEEAREISFLRLQLKEEEKEKVRCLNLFLHGWWKDNGDRPIKEIFQKLKKKKAQEHIPLLKKPDGTQAEDDVENRRVVHNHFASLFSKPPPLSNMKKEAILNIEACRPKTVPNFLAKTLDSPLEIKEIERTIHSMKNEKSPGLDGLPSEFFKAFQSLVTAPLLTVWEEAVGYRALPYTINTGIIKLIHKRGERDVLSNWRPITMLSTAYKIFAKALAFRLSDHLNQWIRKEQKGFVKGRYILDAIVALWEGVEHAETTNQDYCFLKIDFDKAYDRLEWDFIISSLRSMGLNPPFISYIHTLFGNARTRVNVNGELTPTFDIHRSIRQGCPIAPLLYAIAADGFSFLVEKKVREGEITGIQIPGDNQLCLQLFADDTNALLKNEDRNLRVFWECLETYCLASGSVINHSKTGVKTLHASIPDWIKEQGCKEIPEGTIFRLLGIPMGFGTTLKQRWTWAIDRIKAKVEKWSDSMLSMAGRIIIINHYIIPTVIYFLACWRPPECAIAQFNSLCRNFLWSGSGSTYKMPKVKWETCILHKDKGGLGILNVTELANRLASKWIVRSLLNPTEDWAILLHRDLKLARIKDLPKWRDIPQITLFFSQWPVKPKGSPLIQSIWQAWNQIKGMVVLRENKSAIPFIAQDSLWLPLSYAKSCEPQFLEWAQKLHNKGIRCWNDVWDRDSQSWANADTLAQVFNTNNDDWELIRLRTSQLEPQHHWKAGILDQLSPKGVGWTPRTPIFPIPKMELTPPIHVKLNQRWGTTLDRRQWYFKFTRLWSPAIQPKISTHLWLILHQGLWTGEKALKRGIGNGRCPRCRRDVESILHIFISCPHNTLIMGYINKILHLFKRSEVSWNQLLLGDSIGCSPALWNTIRALFLWHIWLQRNTAIFNSPPSL